MSASKKSAFVWALKCKKTGEFLSAQGCYVSPWIIDTLDQARQKAKECAENRLPVTPKQIKLTVIVEEV